MTIIVEDGTGKVDAATYCTTDFADAWHLARGITLWASLSTNEKEQAIVRAAHYLEQAYRLRWVGYRRYTAQALSWPRYDVTRKDMPDTTFSNAAVPIEVQQANAELALKAAAGDLAADITGRLTKKEKVDVIEVEYFEGSVGIVRYRSIDMLLQPLLSGPVGAMRIERA